MFRLVVRAALFASVALLLAACGNKGDLVKPTPQTPVAPQDAARH